MMKKEKTIIELEQGWEILQEGITKLKNILEGTSDSQFTSEEYMILYEAVYTMGTQKPPHDYSEQLYDRYRETIEEYILTTVLPAIREKHEEVMLQEFVKRWSNHKVMVRWMFRFFHYLDRSFAGRRSLPSLNEVGFTCFLNLVYKEMNGRVINAIISLINKEREGDQIDRALVKNVLDVFVEMGKDSMDYYVNDFEQAMLQETASYYSSKASSWILKDSCPEYMLKVEECLNREKERVTHYMHSSSERKLMQKVEDELLYVHASQLLENEHSGCLALLRDNKRDDLSRMFRLFNTIEKGLYTMSLIFKEHVTDERMFLVKHTGYAATNKEISTRKLAELHDKYLDYVVNCFQNHSLFHKSLEESFELSAARESKARF